MKGTTSPISSESGSSENGPPDPAPAPLQPPVPARRGEAFASFRIPAYRRLWVADLFSTWGIEMETVILGWYVLVQTDSAFLVSVIGALRFGGTLFAPAAGVLADRVSRRKLLIGLRVTCALLAASLAFPALAGSLPIAWVFVVAGVTGLVRPSEMILRQSLIADSVPRELLTSALGFGRTTMESARIAGPLIGAALYSAFGIGQAYLAVTAMYLLSVAASFLIPPIPRDEGEPPANPWKEMVAGVRYIRGERVMVVCMLLALLVNVTAFPITIGLMPVLARDVFGTDENGLARMVALVAVGALAGSVLVAITARRVRTERLMIASMCVWHGLIIAFALTHSLTFAYALLALIGLSSTGAMVPVAALLMGQAEPKFRGRVMGVRMLAVYGLPLGLLAAGAMIEWVGVRPTVLLFGTLGLLGVLGTAFVWRRDLNSAGS